MANIPDARQDAERDRALMESVRRGDRGAFAALYDHHAPAIYALAFRIVAEESDAQDLMQEVFLVVWNRAGEFDAKRGSFFAWLVMQMRSRAIDRLRSRRRHSELLDGHATDLAPADGAPSSADACVNGERAQQVRDAMGQLSDEHRQVVRLAFFDGLTQVEIARKLSEPLGTIKTRAHRALARLRNLLRYSDD